MVARRTAGQQQSLLPAIVAGGIAATGLAIWNGLPGPAALTAALLVWAWTEPPPVLTGPKRSGTSNPTPQGAAEERRQEWWQTAQQARFAPVTSAWVPGWPLQASFLFALATAGFAATLPVQKPWMAAVSAVAVFAGVAGFAASRRSATGAPGSTVDALTGMVHEPSKAAKLAVLAVVGGIVGTVAGVLLNGVLAHAPCGPSPVPGLLIAASAVSAAGAAAVAPWRAEALAQWKELCQVRAEWQPRWALVKFDPEPVAVATETVGPFRVTTFDCQGAKGSVDLFNLTGKLDTVLPSGTGYAVIPAPQEFKTGPELGTVHPSKAKMVTWDQTEWPDLTDPGCDPATADIACQVALGTGTAKARLQPVIAVTVTGVHNPESSTALWIAELTLSAGDAGSVRAGGCGSGGLTGGMLGWTVLNHRTETVQLYFGDPQADTSDEVAAVIDAACAEDEWNQYWTASLSTKVNPPVLQSGQTRSASLSGLATVERFAFAVRGGIDVTTMMTPQIERNLVTAIKGTTFLTITGWTERVPGRPGERHKAAFTVYLSKDQVPPSPEHLVPRPGSTAPQWMMSGYFSHAFDALRIPRPEVVSVRALTKAESRGHIWEVRIRLYGGVTFGDVRTQAERLRQALGVAWLRVQDAEDGCVVFCGAAWRKAALANPRRDTEKLIRLDWTQAMTDAKVLGAGNRVPELVSVSTLPHNDNVQQLEFDLPPGVDKEMLQKALPKLRTSAATEYLELRRSARGASAICVLAAEKDPMPEKVEFDPDVASGAGAGFAFATGVEGTPIRFDPEESSHMAVLGTTGSGKTVAAQIIVSAAISAGYEVHIADPTKGAADLLFLKPWARSYSTTMEDTEAALEFVYGEVRRRVAINSQFGCDYRTAPEGHRYGRIMVVLDEFESLYKSFEQLGKPSDDPKVEESRQAAQRHNAALTRILDIVGRIAREARSAGVVMLVLGQKMAATEMEKVGLKTLKNNLGRLLMGKTAWGDRSSALRNPQDAADLGDLVPRGRGLYESMVANAVAVQVWYASQDQLASMLTALVPPVEKLDLEPYRRAEPDKGPSQRPVSMDEVAPLVDVEDLGEVVIGLDELEEIADRIPDRDPAVTAPTAASQDEPASVSQDVFAQLDGAWTTDEPPAPEPNDPFAGLDWSVDSSGPATVEQSAVPSLAADDPWRGLSGWDG